MSNTKKKKQKQKQIYSVLSAQGMGGIYGGGGYKFQDGYIVCQIPLWLADSNFLRLMPEGTGDVDVVFKNGRKEVFDHIQVKDHQVKNSEFKQVVEVFSEIEGGTKIYRKFTLVCPSVSANVSSLVKKLERYRNAKVLYGTSGNQALKTARAALKAEMVKLKLGSFSDFIEEKVYVEAGQFGFSDSTNCRHLYASSLADLPQYKKRLVDMIKSSYAVLFDAISNSRGKVIDSKTIRKTIDSALSGSQTALKDTVLHVHNWTVEKFDNKPSFSLDWSQYFDRQTRKVPDTKTWNKILLPQLSTTRDAIVKKTSNRHLVFRGKCTLSTGIAIGAAFPEVGNWSFELLQPPQIEAWRSDAEKAKNYKLKYEIYNPSSLGLTSGGSDIVFVFGLTGKGFTDVVEYLKKKKTKVKKIILIQPPKGAGNSSIANAGEAVALASLSKDLLRETVAKYKATKTHLFFYGPLGVAIFLGQKLTSVGQIQLYEYKDPSYQPSCLIKT